MDWNFDMSFTYSQFVSEEEIKIDSEDEQQIINMQSKGKLFLHEQNLANILIAKGYPLKEVVRYLIDKFVILNSFQNAKNLPKCFIRLNRSNHTEKGVNKTLKMIATSSVDHEEISEFILKYLPVGTLSAKNIKSFFRFLCKMASSN